LKAVTVWSMEKAGRNTAIGMLPVRDRAKFPANQSRKYGHANDGCCNKPGGIERGVQMP